MARHRWYVLGSWVALVLVMAHFSASTASLLSPSINADTPANRAAEVVKRYFPERRQVALFVAFHSPDVPVAAPAYQSQLKAWQRDLVNLTRDLDAIVEGPVAGQDGQTAALLVRTGEDPDRLRPVVDRASAIHHPGPAQVYLGGLAPVYSSLAAHTQADAATSERVGVPIALILLLLAFGGLVAACLPLFSGLASVAVAVAVLGFIARAHSVSIFSLNISTVLGLGLGIDYSLLIVTRFREELRARPSIEQAVTTTVATAGVTVVVSGLTAAIGFGALLLSDVNLLWSIGLGALLVVAASVLVAVSLVPALLALLGGWVNRLPVPLAAGRSTQLVWAWIADEVVSHPVPLVLLGTALLLILAWPAHQLRLANAGLESVPSTDAARQAQHLLQSGLGAPAHQPILVLARGVDDEVTADRVQSELQLLTGQPVTGPSAIPAATRSQYLRPPYALFEVSQPDADTDTSTLAMVDRLRHSRWPNGVEVQVTGEAATNKDFADLLVAQFPKIFAAVIGLTLASLAIAFRSLVIPLKAVLMNLVSITAALGILAFVFQQGHLANLLRFESVGFVDALVPVLIFTGLFGLSMDYEVFLIGRVREEFVRRGNNLWAVAEGLERTGPIVTSASLILVAVTGTLVLSQLRVTKSIGVTFASAIFLDATVIRLLLVPATLSLLGRLNWWPAYRRGASSGRGDGDLGGAPS